MGIQDGLAYLGVVALLIWKDLGEPKDNLSFFGELVIWSSVAGIFLAAISLVYWHFQMPLAIDGSGRKLYLTMSGGMKEGGTSDEEKEPLVNVKENPVFNSYSTA